MSVLKLYNLDFDKVLIHLKHHLEGINILSDSILNYTRFREGKFYTILHENITQEQLYGFKWGGVGTEDIKNRISYMVMEELEKTSDVICLFDDISSTYVDPYKDPLFLSVGLHYKDEVYYLITKENLSKELLDTCFYGGAWHSLCLLSRVFLPVRKDRSITELEIRRSAEMTQLLILGAYDAESFIFWKKSQ